MSKIIELLSNENSGMNTYRTLQRIKGKSGNAWY